MFISRPLVLIDLETTGTWVEKDKIIEIGMIKRFPGGEKKSYSQRINPGIPIPKIVTKLTGITDSDVFEAPSFRDVSKNVFEFIGDADLGGFNVKRFDLPLLKREFDVGIDFEWELRTVFDSQEIYHIKEKRDLTAAYKYYCDKSLENAHTARGDIEETYEVLEKQLEKYGEGSRNLEVLKDIVYEQKKSYEKS